MLKKLINYLLGLASITSIIGFFGFIFILVFDGSLLNPLINNSIIGDQFFIIFLRSFLYGSLLTVTLIIIQIYLNKEMIK